MALVVVIPVPAELELGGEAPIKNGECTAGWVVPVLSAANSGCLSSTLQLSVGQK